MRTPVVIVTGQRGTDEIARIRALLDEQEGGETGPPSTGHGERNQ